MEVIYSDEAQLDIDYWKKSGSKAVQKKIFQLVKTIEENQTSGIGKPEVLKHNMSGFWSRRIDQEHRIVYEILEDETTVKIHSFKGHYK